MANPSQPDLFGDLSRQGEMFDAPAAGRKPIHSETYGVIELPPPGGHTPDTIRARMLRLIAEARAAETMPWPPARAHTHAFTFPYMAEWLPKEEGEQLLLEFMTEMERLRKAA